MRGKSKNDAVQELAQTLWFALPADKRSLTKLGGDLKAAGHKVSKSTLQRWTATWPAQLVKDAADLALPKAEAALPALAEQLGQIMPDRLLAIAQGEGLDRIEDAIGKLAAAIAEKATDTAKNPTTLHMTANALSVLATATQTAKAARAQVAAAHRDFAMGDKLTAEAGLFRAQAAKVMLEARADGAKDVTPGATSDADRSRVMSALRGIADERAGAPRNH